MAGRCVNAALAAAALPDLGLLHVATDPEDDERRQHAHQEHRAPSETRQHDHVDQRGEARESSGNGENRESRAGDIDAEERGLYQPSL